MISDEEIVYNIRIGKRGALELLFFIYEKKMRFLYHSYETLFKKSGYSNEDIKVIVDQSIYKAVKYYSFDSSSFFYFAVTILKRDIIEIYRKNANTIELKNQLVDFDNFNEDYSMCLSSDEPTLEEEYDALEIKEIIYNLNLKEVDRNVLYLYYLGYSYEEIGIKLNINTKKVGNSLQATRKKLKEKLKARIK